MMNFNLLKGISYAVTPFVILMRSASYSVDIGCSYLIVLPNQWQPKHSE